MSDLVERLHGWSEYGMVEPKALMAEAAERIEALEAENAKLKSDLKTYHVVSKSIRKAFFPELPPEEPTP